jgi:membrane fusion protein (multidrug efflux system)
MNASKASRSLIANILIGGFIILLVVALLAGVKIFQIKSMISAFAATPEEAGTVSTFQVAYQSWPNIYRGVGTVEAQEGITLAAEVPGRVKRIAFKSGDWVEAGAILIEQDRGNETALLQAAEARLQLAASNYQRMVELRKSNTVSQSQLEEALQQRDSARGDVANLKATLDKKIVRAPFSGKLGLRQADLGQDLQVGSPIVTLQATNSVRVNVTVPQDWLINMKTGQDVKISLPNDKTKVLESKLTAIAAELNPVSRNATVQTYVDNAKGWLIPGMAVTTEVILSEPQNILSIPATSVIYATFGDTVFVLEKKEGEDFYRARQQFVRLGKSRGDFVEVLDGLKEGELVVSTGAFKLRSNMRVNIGELPEVEFSLTPDPVDN